MKHICDPSQFVKAVVVFVGYLVLCNFTGAGALCSGAIMSLAQGIWLYVLSMKFSRSLEEMKDELWSMKNQLRICNETLSQKVEELENANDEIAVLKQEREALIAHADEVNNLNNGGKIGDAEKIDSCSDSGVGASIFLPTDAPVGLPDVSMDKPASPADTSAGPNSDISNDRLNSEDFPSMDLFFDFGEYFYTLKSFLFILTNAGYEEDQIISSFIISLFNSKLATSFFHEMAKMGHGVPKDINELMYVLGCCDREFMEKTPEQRFRDLVRNKDETLEHFLSRCKIYVDQIQFPRFDESRRNREIKAQFLKGANIASNIQQKLRPYSDLYELITACKDLVSKQRHDKKFDKPSKSKYQNGKFKNRYPVISDDRRLKKRSRTVQSPHMGPVVPLMDIKFPLKTMFMQRTVGLRFEQIMDGSYPILG